MRTEDDPGGFLSEQVSALAFKAHPYGQPVIGWAEDVERITPEAMRAFYRTYYVPNNAIVVAAGDFRAPEVLARITQRFGSIPRGPDPPPVLAVEPPQAGERRVVVQRQAELPIVYLAYHVPSGHRGDAPALEVLSTVLSGGRASRLYRGLVSEGQIALEAGGDYTAFMLDPVSVLVLGHPVARADAGDGGGGPPRRRWNGSRRIPCSDEELQRAKNQIEAELVFARDSVHRRANQLARFELLGGYALDATLPRQSPRGHRGGSAAGGPHLLLQRPQERRHPPSPALMGPYVDSAAGAPRRRAPSSQRRRRLGRSSAVVCSAAALRRRSRRAGAPRGPAERDRPARGRAPRGAHRGRAGLRAGRRRRLRPRRPAGPRQSHGGASHARHGASGPQREIDAAIEFVGGRLEAGADRDGLVAAVDVLRKDLVAGTGSAVRGAADAGLSPRGADAQGQGDRGRHPARRGEPGGRRRTRPAAPGLRPAPLRLAGGGDARVRGQAHARRRGRLLPARTRAPTRPSSRWSGPSAWTRPGAR